MSPTKFPEVKSDLQAKLESEGWEFLSNQCNHPVERGESLDPSLGPAPDDTLNSDLESIWVLDELPHLSADRAIHGFYLSRGFKEVLVTDAYDTNGRPIQDMRAVYVKR